tara:strand:+ start:750 stop:1328 length:579 start_codon:yes stop_codon:yes gene_type:complete
MASISGATTSDGTYLNIQYSLSGETFKSIQGRIYKGTQSVTLITPSQVQHDIENPVSGNFSVLKPMADIVKELGESPGLLLLEIRVADKDKNARGSTAYVLITVDLDCCLAQKMNKIVDCGNDPNCDDHFDDAQKMFLFMKSSQFVMNTISNTSGFSQGSLDADAIAKLNDAEGKYKKALELCSGNLSSNTY